MCGVRMTFCETRELRLEGVGHVLARLRGEDVDRRATEVPRAQRVRERPDVDDRAAAEVQEARAGLHAGELRGADHLVRLGRRRDVERHEIGLLEDLLHRGKRDRVAHRELADDVVEHDPHSEHLGEHTDLAPDVTVPDDAERLAADLVRPRGALAPSSRVHLAHPVADPSREHHDLGDDELGDAPRVAERCVEHGDTLRARRIERDLVRSDAERSDDEELIGGFEHRARELGLRADTDDVDATDPLGYLLLGEGPVGQLDLEARVAKRLARDGMDALEEQDADGLDWLRHGKRGVTDPEPVSTSGGRR